MYELGVCYGAGGSSGFHGGAAVNAASAASSAADVLVLSGRDNGRPHVSGFLSCRKRYGFLFCIKMIRLDPSQDSESAAIGTWWKYLVINAVVLLLIVVNQ